MCMPPSKPRRGMKSGPHHVSLRGALLFESAEINVRTKPPVEQINKLGLTGSFCIDTFLDASSGNRRYDWEVLEEALGR